MNQKKSLLKLLTTFSVAIIMSLYFVGLATVQARGDEKAIESGKVMDFGLMMEKKLHRLSSPLFGFGAPLMGPASMDNYVAREHATADQRVLLAKGLQAKFVSRNIAYLGDMMALRPNDKNYSHLIICIEQTRAGKTPKGKTDRNVTGLPVLARTFVTPYLSSQLLKRYLKRIPSNKKSRLKSLFLIVYV